VCVCRNLWICENCVGVLVCDFKASAAPTYNASKKNNTPTKIVPQMITQGNLALEWKIIYYESQINNKCLKETCHINSTTEGVD
jgi:hypothetical protein